VTLDACIRNLVSWTSCSIAQAVECVTSHPAKLLGITDQKGFLKPGLDADLAIVDDEGNLFQTWKFGEKVFDVEEVLEEEEAVVEEDLLTVPAQPAQKAKRPSLAHIGQFKEAISYGERFASPDSPIARVTSPGVKVF
jgi:adenine deaminase